MTRMFDAAGLSGPEAIGLIDDILAASSGCSIVGTDLDGNITLWNEGARRLFGWEPEEVVGRANREILHTAEEIASGLPKQILATALELGRWEGTVSRTHKDGSRLVVHVVATPMRCAGERDCRGVLLIATDASDDLRLTHDLPETQSFTRMFEANMSPLVITDPAGRVIDVNFRLESLTGRERGELIGSSFGDHFIDTARAEGVPGLALRDERLNDCQLRLRGGDGRELDVVCNAATVYDAAGKLYGVLIAIADVTDQKLHEGRLELANADLERANQGKDSFLASMGHELRTPLNAILGFTSILLRDTVGQLSPEQRNQLQTVESAGRHQLSIVNDLMDLSRITSGRWTGHFRQVSCRAEAEEMAAHLGVLARAKGIAFRVVPPVSEVSMVTDPRALRQILLNLVGNAIKFTAEGEVRVEIHRRRRGGAAVAFDVIDSGVGIRPEDQARLFGAFEQARQDTIDAFEGTGLGLYVSQRLAGELGGVISFTSELGRGSVFTLTLPVRPREMGTAVRTARPRTGRPTGPRAALLADGQQPSPEVGRRGYLKG